MTHSIEIKELNKLLSSRNSKFIAALAFGYRLGLNTNAEQTGIAHYGVMKAWP